MRFWAVILVAVLFSVHHAILFSYGGPNVITFAYHAILLAILFGNRSKMKTRGSPLTGPAERAADGRAE